MVSKKTKTPAGANCGVLGKNVAHCQTINARDIPLPLAEIQTIFIVRRTRLRPAVARVVAELHFGRAAA